MVDYIKAVMNTPIHLPFLVSWKKNQELGFFCRQLAAMIGAGVTVFYSLHLLAEQAEKKLFREKLEAVAKRVETGYSLADSFREHEYFPPIFISMVEAGEAGGTLVLVFERLAQHFEKQHRLEQKIKAATAYPKFVLGIVVAVIFLLMGVVLPTFVDVFGRMGIEVPLLTRLFMAGGSFFITYWYLLLFTLVLFGLAARWFCRTARGAYLYNLSCLYCPIWGPIYKKILLARFCRTLSTLLSSGLGILAALELVSRVMGSIIFKNKVQQVIISLTQGESLGATLKTTRLFPPMLIGMTSVGEQSGNLESLLARAADYYEGEVASTVEQLGTILEPFLILFMALIVGSVVLSIMLPMLEIFTGIGL